ncbi:ssDNA binding protein and ssDNA annealing protein [Ralstonia phage BOESR1]|uniref:SsDNA binding protein and ssDNA annealing protein n=1 Tax=Ralstonia phage BOESR1 TaxID=3034917 RepID=A0AA50ID71_9CAUD|nr:ssDNA binding protein and ssDNA annealing protein [Ralstonia phage BOESR1]WLW40586.1 ssDNA binding protein and ssDNA annealing protein [Ralstonia phage BOESR1]
MADKKQKNPEFTSPRGVFVYPKLNEPDYGNEKFPKPDGEYSVNLRMTREAAEQWINAKLKTHLDEAYAEAEAEFAKLPVGTRKKLGSVTQNDLFKIEYDKETEEETGFVTFKFAMKAGGKTKAGKEWSRKPVIFDAKGKKMVKTPDIWGGTEGKVSFEARPYFIPGTGAAGLKLALNAVQVIDLKSGGGRDAEGYGFGEEDGYEYDEMDAKEESGGFADETTTDGSEDF